MQHVEVARAERAPTQLEDLVVERRRLVVLGRRRARRSPRELAGSISSQIST
jgi:hypothetical protein